MWIRQFQKQLQSGVIVSPAMTPEQKASLKEAEHRIKELEKAGSQMLPRKSEVYVSCLRQ
jgi:hypothetical protein